MFIYLAVAITLLILHFVFIAKVLGFFSPTSILIYMHFAMLAGMAPYLDLAISADRTLLSLHTWTFSAIVVVSGILTMGFTDNRNDKTHKITISGPGPWTIFFLLLSVLIGIIYFVAIGYLTIFESLKGLFLGVEVDVATLRIESYAGQQYFFPGYVNQFKNSLLPALSIVIISYLHFNGKRYRRFITFLLVVVSTILLLGTGQRGAFAIIVLVALMYIYYLNPNQRVKNISVLLTVFIPLFLFSTFALGRKNAEIQSANSFAEKVLILFEAMHSRVFGENQRSAIQAFRYIYELPTQRGQEWLTDLLGMLPGRQGSGLSNIVFSTVYGSTRGTMPPSVWGSAYHNWGMVLTVVLAGLIALLVFWLSTLVPLGRISNTIELIGYVGVSIVVVSWVAGDPSTLFNTGLVIYVLLWLFGRKNAMKNQQKLLN